jgi:hypothetical protein
VESGIGCQIVQHAAEYALQVFTLGVVLGIALRLSRRDLEGE